MVFEIIFSVTIGFVVGVVALYYYLLFFGTMNSSLFKQVMKRKKENSITGIRRYRVNEYLDGKKIEPHKEFFKESNNHIRSGGDLNGRWS